MMTSHIKLFREQRHMTQQQLAERVGISRQTVIAIEKGNYEPSLGLALKLANIFRVSVEQLFVVK